MAADLSPGRAGPADEFDDLSEAAAELGLEGRGGEPVNRYDVTVAGGMTISVLRWGDAPPELVLLHGGGQNARTWDLFSLLVKRPLIALDLPGHGRSSWLDDHDYSPQRNAESVAQVVERLAPNAAAVVGMSLGGLTTIRLASQHPELVRKAVLVDITPGAGQRISTMSVADRGATVLTRSSPVYPTLEEMVSAAVGASPRRPASAVRRGVLHNSRELPDGRRVWRYDPVRETGPRSGETFEPLWADLSDVRAPVLLVRGGSSAFVGDEDVAEVLRRQPGARVVLVDGSGHAVQSDRPRELASVVEDFVFG